MMEHIASDRTPRNWSTPGLVCVLFSAICVSGCRSAASRRMVELESRVRIQEQQIRSLESARRQDAEVITASGETPSRPAVALKINSLLSGGLDRNDVPGDDTLSFLISPVDQAGQPVRTGDRLEIRAIDFSQSGSEQTVGSWDYDGDTLSALWHSGVFGKGYQARVAMSEPQQDRQLTIHARLTQADGKQLDASTQITFRAGRVDSAGAGASGPRSSTAEN